MKIGIPTEIKPQEKRVALTPEETLQLSRKHRVMVQEGAGNGSGFSDEAYREAGAVLAATREEIFAEAEVIVKVKEPLADECALLREGQIIFTYLHLAASESTTRALMRSGATCIAYETIAENRRLPLLEPMSEIAGRSSAIAGAYFLGNPRGGSGVLLGGVPGVLPAKVVILGGGVSGINAARMALGLGADVIILELNPERIRQLDLSLPGVRVAYSSEHMLRELLPSTDLLIGAVLVPGARAPRLMTRPMLRLMRPGSVFVDIAIDQGGCAETSRPTTHADPVYVEEGVVHYCVANMPGAYARTATQALTSATFPFLQLLADHGLDEACVLRPSLTGGINVRGGKIVNEVVAAAFPDLKA